MISILAQPKNEGANEGLCFLTIFLVAVCFALLETKEKQMKTFDL
jgi:hypothetical protein